MFSLWAPKGEGYLERSGGMLSQEIFKTEHSETLFPAFLEPKNQQGWSSLKFSLSKIFNEIGQLVGEMAVSSWVAEVKKK